MLNSLCGLVIKDANLSKYIGPPITNIHRGFYHRIFQNRWSDERLEKQREALSKCLKVGTFCQNYRISSIVDESKMSIRYSKEYIGRIMRSMNSDLGERGDNDKWSLRNSPIAYWCTESPLFSRGTLLNKIFDSNFWSKCMIHTCICTSGYQNVEEISAKSSNACGKKKDSCKKKKKTCDKKKKVCGKKKDACGKKKKVCDKKKTEDVCANLKKICDKDKDPCSKKKDVCELPKDECGRVKDRDQMTGDPLCPRKKPKPCE